MITTDIMQDASEIVHYDTPDIPVYIRISNLSKYPDMKALCHWHEDIELICILEGEMNYHINGRTILLNANDCLVINSRQLHYGYSHLHRHCRFACIIFHPNLLSANQKIYKNYVIPIIENRKIEYLHYREGSGNHLQIKELTDRILSVKSENENGYELEILSCLQFLWLILFRQCSQAFPQKTEADNSDLALQKKMVSYIYEHYQDSLTLDEISASSNISRSKCCNIFRQYLQQSPIEFLNKYRLEVGRYLLAHTSSGITQIALSCGFNHPSYFSKMFLREYGCTPTEYRKKEFHGNDLYYRKDLHL